MQGKGNCYSIMGSITSSLSSATPGKTSRWVLKCLCECRETIHNEYLGLLATEMLFNVHSTPKTPKDLLHMLPK